MDFDLPQFLLSLAFSGVGLAYLRIGKQRQDLWYIVPGLILLGFGYFVSSALALLIIGMIVSVIPFIK